MRNLHFGPVLFSIVCLVAASEAGRRRTSKLNDFVGEHHAIEEGSNRAGKLFSLFSVVTFKQTSCTLSTDASQTGTCMTSSECTSKGGNKDGHCAAGFGVCCSFTVKTCPGSVNQNCTYVQNPEYPSATSESSCSITFNRIEDNLCQIRLDFDTLTTAQPPTATSIAFADPAVVPGIGLCGDQNTDTITVTSPTGKNPPVICGDLTGQHMFLETGASGTAGKVDFSFGSVSATRNWQIKVTYYACDSVNKAPADCVQYYTGRSGTLISYNYPNALLANQNYASCIRQEEGFCGANYQESSGTSPDTFNLLGTAGAADAAAEIAACQTTYVSFSNVDSSTLAMADGAAILGFGRFCGGVLSHVNEDTAPGQVNSMHGPLIVETYSINVLARTGATGYSIDFSQNPCNTGV